MKHTWLEVHIKIVKDFWSTLKGGIAALAEVMVLAIA